jgi:hypothetical protein
VSPVKYEQGFYIPEDTILHSHRLGNLKSYMLVLVCIDSLVFITFLMKIQFWSVCNISIGQSYVTALELVE